MLRDEILKVLETAPLKKKKLEEMFGGKRLNSTLRYYVKKGYLTSNKGVYSLAKKPKKYTYKRVLVKTEVYDGC